MRDHRTGVLLAGSVLASVLVGLACGDAEAPTRHAALELGACEAGAAAVGGSRCGDYEVYENRDAMQGRRIALHVQRVPALGKNPRPEPLVILAGGPGQAATEVGPAMLSRLRAVRRTHDILLVDQRGTGSSNPLDCVPDDDDEVSALFRVSVPEDELRRCLEGYDADPRHYTTWQAADDLDEVRAALGYERLDLYGASYGTRAALVYMRRHPDHVRAVVLDGVAPFGIELPSHMGEDGQAALGRLFEDCAAQADCVRAFGDLEQKWSDLMSTLAEAPARIRLPHPRHGRIGEADVRDEAVAAIVRNALYAGETGALVPYAIDRALVGDFGPLAALAAAGEGTGDSLSMGMFLSVVCSEDLPHIDEDEVAAARTSGVLGSALMDWLETACAQWPTASLPDGYVDSVHSDAPTLLLSGELDPATPPRWAEEARANLPRGHHLVVPGIGHGTWRHGCVAALIAEFLAMDEPDARALDPACLDRLVRPPFMLSPAGPRLATPRGNADEGGSP